MPNEYTKKWLAFTGIALLSFGCYLDYTVVNVALPTLQKQLQANLTELQWIMNIYFLALCIFATMMGRLGDLYGRRRIFYTGAIIFGIASLIAGFSPNIQTLIAGRLLQGIGAAIVLPLGPSILPTLFPKDEHAKSIAYLGSLGGIALALGPVVGGLIVTHGSWRWIFFINIPIIIFGFLFCLKSVTESKSEHSQSELDWLGAVLMAIAIGGIVLAILHGQDFGWMNLTTLIYLVIGIISSIILYRVESRKTNPLLDFKDFSHLLFFAGAIFCFLAGVLSAVALFFDPLYLQIVRGQSPQTVGFILFAIPIAVFVLALIVGWLVKMIGIIPSIIFGLILAMVAGFMQIFFTSTISIYYILIAYIFLGGMWGLGNIIPIIAAQTAVGPHRASVATGTIVTMFNIGGSLGLAVGVAVYHLFANRALEKITQSQIHFDQLTQLQQFIQSPGSSQGIVMSDMMHSYFIDCFMHGFTGVMWFLTIVSLVLLLSLIFKYSAD